MMIQQTFAAPIKHPEKFFIGGRWTVPSSGARLNVITPLTEQVYFTVAKAHEADINAAVAAARYAFDEGP